MKLMRIIALAAALFTAGPLAAQSPVLAQAIEAGQVGERYDGYLGLVGSPTPDVRRQVAAINIRRRNLYISLAGRRNVTPEIVGMATACQLFSRLSPGQAYMLNDGLWRRHAAGQPVPVPDYCR